MILRHKSDLTQKLKTVLSSRRELTLDCRKEFQNEGFFDDGAGEVHRTFFLGFLMVTLDSGGHQRGFKQPEAVPPGGGRGRETWSELRERARRKANCHLEDRMQEQVSGANVQNVVF